MSLGISRNDCRNVYNGGPLRKLLQLLNGFSAEEVEAMKKRQELRDDLLPLARQCQIECFYLKSKHFRAELRSKDLTAAILESAFRFEPEQMELLLYYLFYDGTPSIIDSDAMMAPLTPLEIEWNDLHKIYAVLLGLSPKAMNHLKDLDIQHLLNCAPLPVRDIQRIDAHTNYNELDALRLTRNRQQRVLQLVSGIGARSGCFESVTRSLFYFEHDSIITNAMRSFGSYYLNETLLHRFTNHCVQFRNEGLSEAEYVQSVKEMTQRVYAEWSERIEQILEHDSDDRPRYQ